MKKYIEIVNKEIVITTDQVIPLVRYNLHDKGMFITNTKIKKIALKNKSKNIAFDKNEHLYLAVFGRNINTKFSTEDIRHLLDKLEINNLFHYEFQFKENNKQNVTELILTLYRKAEVKISQKKIKYLQKYLIENLQRIINKPNQVVLNLKIIDGNKRIGYKYGKLRYILKTNN